MSWAAIFAQCVMCYRSAAAQSAARARVFNLGIIILLIPPGLILAGILFIAIRKDGRSPFSVPKPNTAPKAQE
jgi:hypothetical protein